MENPLDETDIWDDTLLVKAYNSSVNVAKEEIAKRIAQSTNKNSSAEFKDIQPINKIDSNHKVGDYVRATFEDGIDYEAKVLSIDKDKGICRLKYIGYDNEQTIDLNELIPSWGKMARKVQLATARQENECHTDSKGNKSKTRSTTFPTMAWSSQMAPPPPPPMPPMFSQDSKFEDSAHLSAMLMAWYMSGYYTGVYQGINMSKKKTKLK